MSETGPSSYPQGSSFMFTGGVKGDSWKKTFHRVTFSQTSWLQCIMGHHLAAGVGTTCTTWREAQRQTDRCGDLIITFTMRLYQPPRCVWPARLRAKCIWQGSKGPHPSHQSLNVSQKADQENTPSGITHISIFAPDSDAAVETDGNTDAGKSATTTSCSVLI